MYTGSHASVHAKVNKEKKMRTDKRVRMKVKISLEPGDGKNLVREF